MLKFCESCGRRIARTAENCRHCGRTFPELSPVETASRWRSFRKRVPGSRTLMTVAVLIVSLLLLGFSAWVFGGDGPSVSDSPDVSVGDITYWRTSNSPNPLLMILTVEPQVFDRKGWSTFMTGSRPGRSGEASGAAYLLLAIAVIAMVCWWWFERLQSSRARPVPGLASLLLLIAAIVGAVVVMDVESATFEFDGSLRQEIRASALTTLRIFDILVASAFLYGFAFMSFVSLNSAVKHRSFDTVFVLALGGLILLAVSAQTLVGLGGTPVAVAGLTGAILTTIATARSSWRA